MNKVELLGRITKDPEIKYTQDQKMIAKFTLAINRRVRELTDFFDITAFGKTAEFVSKYYKKGQQVAIVGRLQNNNYTDSEGKKHYENIVICDECYFADSKKEEATETKINYEDDLPF